jgi:hypothetical protein
MSWLFSQALVAEYLGGNFSDGEQSAPLNGNPIQQAYCAPDKMTDFSRLSRFGMTYKPLTENLGEELLTLFRAGFPVKTLAQPEKAQGLTESDQECGATWRGWLAKYDPDTSLWRTAQCSLLEDLNESLATLPRSGMTRNGLLWELPMLEQTTKGTESGLSVWIGTPTATMSERSEKFAEGRLSTPAEYVKKWPTPRSCSAMAATITPESAWNEKRNPNLETIVGQRQWPSPKARDWKDGKTEGTSNRQSPDLGKVVGQSKTTGALNPTWVEWLMGWPLGWTDLKPLETDKSHCVQQQHGKS